MESSELASPEFKILRDQVASTFIYADKQLMSSLIEYYKDKKVVVLDRHGVITDEDTDKLQTGASDAIKLLQEQGYSVIVWSADGNERVKNTKMELSQTGVLASNILWISGITTGIEMQNSLFFHDYDDMQGKSLLNLLELGVLTQEQADSLVANADVYDILSMRKPTKLFFPAETLLLDDYNGNGNAFNNLVVTNGLTVEFLREKGIV